MATRVVDILQQVEWSSALLVRNFRQAPKFEKLKTILVWYLIYQYSTRLFWHIRAKGIKGTFTQLRSVVIRRVYKVLLRLPFLSSKIQSEMDAATLSIVEQIAPEFPGIASITTLPVEGVPFDKLQEMLDSLSSIPATEWKAGRVSGAVYHGGPEMSRVWQEAFAKFEVSNPLHPDVFPGLRKMESEVVKMCLRIYNANIASGVLDDEGAVGCTTSGGTESIVMACKAYRDWAAEEKGITRPEMIVPISAHAAFDKAASYFKIKIHYIPVDPITRQVDIAQVKRAINPNTIMLVGSACNFPDGIIDDISSLSRLAIKYKLGLHVDCCLGSFIVPFLEKAGFETALFDFRLAGVTSISCDTHKYGFAPKGSSVIMYKNRKYRKYQYSSITTWTGGVYASPTLAGSRPGAIIAGAWATLMSMGEAGYIESCKSIVGARQKIEEAIREEFKHDLIVLGKPLASVVAFASKNTELSIYDVGDRLSKKGWHLNALQNPPALHIACTRLTVAVVPELLDALREAIKESKEAGPRINGSMTQIYGLGSATAIGPHLVDEMSRRFIDVLYA